MVRVEQYGEVKLKLILFGDDEMGTVVDEKFPYKGRRGIMMKAYLFVPSAHLRKQYPELREESRLKVATPFGDAVWSEYPTYWVSDENPSRTNAIARIDCAFDGGETPQTRRFSRYTHTIRDLEEARDNLLAGNLVKMEQNKMLFGNLKELVKDSVEIAELGAPPPKPVISDESKEG